MKQRRRADELPPYRPTPRRRRLLIALLAVCTALVVLWLMLRPRLQQMQAEAERRAAPPLPCAAGRSEGCIGGTTQLIVPATPRTAPPAPAAARASS